MDKLKQNIKDKSGITDDPVKMITRTWPWKDQDGGLSQALRPLLTRGANNTTEEDIFNKDPLVSFYYRGLLDMRILVLCQIVILMRYQVSL